MGEAHTRTAQKQGCGAQRKTGAELFQKASDSFRKLKEKTQEGIQRTYSLRKVGGKKEGCLKIKKK